MSIESYTKFVQPTYHNPKIRTVFTLGNMLVTSDLRLANIQSTLATNYPDRIGAWSLIKKVFLYDGETLLSSNENVPYFMSFLSLLHGNSDDISKYSQLYRSSGGFVVDKNDGNKYNYSGNVDFVKSNNNGNNAWLNLKDVLWMLKYTEVMQFQNLRLVIEWAQSTVEEPTLVCLQVNGNIKMKPFEYFDIEIDKTKFDAVAGGAPQIASKNIDGFNGKMISRLLIGLQDSTLPYASVQQVSESVQLFNSNTEITPSPITEQNKLSYLEGAWGPLNIPVGSQYSASANADKQKILNNNITSLVGTHGWIGLDVDSSEPIISLSMKYQRVGGAVATQQSALSVHIFGLVKKIVGENKVDQAVVAEL